MAGSIEELNEKLKAIKEGRDPAQTIDSKPIDVDGYLPSKDPKLSYGQEKQIFELPAVADPKNYQNKVPASSFSSEKIVGGRAPDYSGFDDMINELAKQKPRDTSNMDLLAMGLTTGLGAMYGQVGAAAKAAGDYGTKRAAAQEKREDDFLKQLNAIRLARAAQMAKGMKGQKVKSGSGSTNWRAQVRRGADGGLYWMTNVDENGKFVPSDDDMPFTSLTPKTVDLKRPDGSLGQEIVAGNKAITVGSQNAQMKNIKNAEDQQVLVNTRTGGVQDLGPQFNQTGMKLTPNDQKDYNELRNKKTADDNLERLKGSYDDMVAGMTALGRGDIGNMKVSLKMLASALEKGRMTSDADLRQVSDMNMGLSGYFEKKLDAAANGDIGIEEVRKEMESAYSTILAATRDGYQRRLETYNSELRRAVPGRKDLEWGTGEIPEFGAKKQAKLINKSINTAKDLVSTGEREDYLRDPNGNIVYDGGKPVRAKYIRDPQTKKWIAVERVK